MAPMNNLNNDKFNTPNKTNKNTPEENFMDDYVEYFFESENICD